jgi:type II secretory pathway component PulF
MTKSDRIILSANDKLTLLSNMSTMLKAGIPILEIVDSLLDGAKGNQKKILDTMREDLNQGKHVYFTLEKFPRVFDQVTVNIIKASEEAGTLDTVLNDVKDGIRKDMEFSDKIRSALMYPVFIFFVFIAVLVMILIVVIPKISTVFSKLHVVLPLPTKILIFVSNALLTYTIPIILVVVSLGVGLAYLYKMHKGAVMAALYKLPVISELAHQIDLTRFSHSLYLLLNAGIPIVTALELTEAVVKKKEVGKAITRATEVVSAGKKLSEGFKETPNAFPSIMIKMTEAGEKTGSLEKAMEDTSEYLDYQVSKSLKTLTTLLEPIMLLFVGVMVGGMMLAIIAPIYSLIGQVGPH